ncbi:amino acid ABC transporter substrate-binding protein, partial [Pseudomonas aeruginosa]
FLTLNKDTPDALVQNLQTAKDALRSKLLLNQIR